MNGLAISAFTSLLGAAGPDSYILFVCAACWTGSLACLPGPKGERVAGEIEARFEFESFRQPRHAHHGWHAGKSKQRRKVSEHDADSEKHPTITGAF